MIIGKFQNDNGVFIGSIPMFASPGLSVRIAPTTQKGIDCKVMLSGSGIELGVAWKRTSAKGNGYLSVKLDSPILPAPVHCALVKQGDEHALVWDREKPKTDA